MAGGAGSANIQDLLQMGNQRQQAQRQQQYIPEEKQAQPIRPSAQAGSWQCSCGAVNTGKFCMECGTSKAGRGLEMQLRGTEQRQILQRMRQSETGSSEKIPL